jgi:hypothetical protein
MKQSKNADHFFQAFHNDRYFLYLWDNPAPIGESPRPFPIARKKGPLIQPHTRKIHDHLSSHKEIIARYAEAPTKGDKMKIIGNVCLALFKSRSTIHRKEVARQLRTEVKKVIVSQDPQVDFGAQL